MSTARNHGIAHHRMDWPCSICRGNPRSRARVWFRAWFTYTDQFRRNTRRELLLCRAHGLRFAVTHGLSPQRDGAATPGAKEPQR